MKILDRYILTSFLKTFFPLFIIIIFILLLQTIWLFITELAGKDLDFSVIIKFLTFALPRLIPIVLPLTILLTSIMIFGNLAENYEFAAMKSSGISLQRAMRNLSVLMVFVGIGAFIFANTVMPQSERKFINLRKNIFKLKPAMVIAPNQFNDLGEINIKVAEKYGKNDEFLKDIIIHKKSSTTKNLTVIKAVDGELKGSIDSDLVTLVLSEGNYYDEIQPDSPKRRKKLPFAKAYFKEYILNLDLSSLDNNVDMDAQQSKKGFNMLNIVDLQGQIDTFSIRLNKESVVLKNDINRLSGFNELNRNLKIDSTQHAEGETLPLMDSFKTKDIAQIYSLAFSNVEGVLRKITTNKKRFADTRRALNKYEMSLHLKYALGVACVLLFFVGAPLGAIIRKGGLGLPIVVGVFLFLTYHFIGIFAKNGAEEGGIPPFLGSWLSTFIILPLSIFLTYRATTDQGFFSFDNFIQPVRDFFAEKKLKRTHKKMAKREGLIKETISSVDTESEMYQLLVQYDDKKLEDIVENYIQYEYDEAYRITSLKILNDRGVSVDEPQIKKEFNKADLDKAEKYFENFKEYSILTITLGIFLISINLIVRLISKEASTETEVTLLVFNVISVGVYILFFILSFLSHDKFYRLVKDRSEKPNVIFFLLGFPFYIPSYFYYRKVIKEDMNTIR